MAHSRVETNPGKEAAQENLSKLGNLESLENLRANGEDSQI